MRVGLITYNTRHLKTEQLLWSYLRDTRIEHIGIHALPFVQREERFFSFSHRPEMGLGLHTARYSSYPQVTYQLWNGRDELYENYDVFVIAGAGILDPKFANGKPIINAHPGIIPQSRGLDAFKWAIYEDKQLGVTLHSISNEIDSGEILQIELTPVFAEDSLSSLARRHYELEIALLSDIPLAIKKKPFINYPEHKSKLRMKPNIEKQMIRRFPRWKEKWCKERFYDENK